ncbi:MAG: putative ribosomally synthesized peptide with SipW-like signal peptide [Natronomonas sp.]
MQDLTVSRRQALAGLAVIGATSAGVGLGTRALFSDTEEFSKNNVTAGELDLKVAWRKSVTQVETRVETSSEYPTPTNDVDAPICELADVKPGDHGVIEFIFRIDDNPGYVSLLGAEQADEENGQPEPERGALSESIPVGREGELDELINTTVSYGTIDSDDDVTAATRAYTSSLASLIGLGNVGSGVILDGDGSASVVDILLGNATPNAFEPGTKHGLRVEFEVPRTVGNGVQTDRYEFATGFFGEQARNNETWT